MRWAEKLRMLTRSLFRRRQIEADLAAEIRDHMQQEIESNLRAGMTAEEAKLAAQRLMGPASVYKEE